MLHPGATGFRLTRARVVPERCGAVRAWGFSHTALHFQEVDDLELGLE